MVRDKNTSTTLFIPQVCEANSKNEARKHGTYLADTGTVKERMY